MLVAQEAAKMKGVIGMEQVLYNRILALKAEIGFVGRYTFQKEI